MQLGRYQVSTLRPAPILGISFAPDGRVFAVATEQGYEIWKTCPLRLLRRRVLPGTLERAVPLPHSPLLVLQGGGSNPLYPPNKAVLFHDGRGCPVAELEFSERVRGIAVRQRTVVIVLFRRAMAYEYGMDKKGKGKQGEGFCLRKLGEWETAENESGLVALATAPGATLLALPGRQAGHVQLINLPRQNAMPVSFRSPIILAHTHPLSALSCSANGAYLLTASERGTLVRVWDVARGAQESELRRGVDRAEIWGLGFEDDKRGRVVGWSDKGTVHVWNIGPRPKPQGLTSVLGKALSLPNYFSSAASMAQYYLPRKNPHAFSSAFGAAAGAAGLPNMQRESEDEEAERYVVGWIEVEVEVEDPPPEPFRPQRLMGTREERRSFGSDSTRTATPSIRTQTPTMDRRPSQTPTRPGAIVAASRRSSTGSTRRRKQSSENVPSTTTVREKQLVVITHAGDWYRLRLPRAAQEDEIPNTKCELAEYRRLGVGGGGW